MRHFRNTIRTRIARQLAVAGALVLALTLVGSCSNMITDLTAGGDAGQESTAVTGVSVSPTSASIVSGDTQQLTATVSPSDATDTSVSWSSSDEAVATVDSSGLVTGVADGTTTITVSTTDGSKTAESTITVSTAVTGVSVSPAGATIAPSATEQFSATVNPTGASDTSVTWSSSDQNIATVNLSGQVTGVAAGSATITVTTTDGGETADALISVNEPFSFTGTSVASATQTPTGSLNNPRGLEVDQYNNLWLAEFSGDRVTKYDIITPGSPAGTVFADDTVDNRPTIYPSQFGSPGDVAIGDSGALAISDAKGGNRVLVWASSDRDSSNPPDLILGDDDSDTSNTNGAATELSRPRGVHIAGDMLFAADSTDNVVYVWKDLSQLIADGSNGAAADLILGTVSSSGNGQNELNQPYDVWSDGTTILVGDRNNNRVLVWDSIPDTDGANATYVIGQAGFGSSDKGLSDSTLATDNVSGGAGIYMTVDSEGQLFVSDSGNHRVLVFNSIPTDNGVSADAVIGQNDFTTGTTGTFNQPTGIAVDQNGSLWVANYGSDDIDRFD